LSSSFFDFPACGGGFFRSAPGGGFFRLPVILGLFLRRSFKDDEAFRFLEGAAVEAGTVADALAPDRSRVLRCILTYGSPGRGTGSLPTGGKRVDRLEAGTVVDVLAAGRPRELLCVLIDAALARGTGANPAEAKRADRLQNRVARPVPTVGIALVVPRTDEDAEEGIRADVVTPPVETGKSVRKGEAMVLLPLLDTTCVLSLGILGRCKTTGDDASGRWGESIFCDVISSKLCGLKRSEY